MESHPLKYSPLEVYELLEELLKQKIMQSFRWEAKARGDFDHSEPQEIFTEMLRELNRSVDRVDMIIESYCEQHKITRIDAVSF